MNPKHNLARWLNNTLTLGSIFALGYFALTVGLRAWGWPELLSWGDDRGFVGALWILPVAYGAGALISWQTERRRGGGNPKA